MGKNASSFEELREEWNLGKGLAAQTSGSTGTPKTITLSRHLVEQSARRTIDFFSLNSLSHLHSCIGFQYIGGKMMYIRAALANARFTHEVPSSVPQFSSDTADRYDLVSVVPVQVQSILEDVKHYGSGHIGNLLIGGQRIDSRLRRQIAASGISAWESYGMTETSSHIALRKVTEPESAFFPLPGITVSVDDRETLKIEIPGCGLTLQTNDLVKFNKNGSFNILGRYDNIIISGGCKVNPTEIENELSPFFNSNFAVTGIEDPKWGEHPAIIAEEIPKDVDKLRSAIKNMAPHERPKELAISLLPMTESCKVNRSMLKKTFYSSTLKLKI